MTLLDHTASSMVPYQSEAWVQWYINYILTHVQLGTPERQAINQYWSLMLTKYGGNNELRTSLLTDGTPGDWLEFFMGDIHPFFITVKLEAMV